MTARLLVGTPLPDVQGHVAAQCHLCQLPILQEKKDLVTGPMQPDDVQRRIAHVAFVRCSGRHTFVFRPSFAFTLPHWTLWAAHFPFFSQLGDLKSISISSFFRHYVQGDERTLLEDISREEVGTDVRIDERAEGLTVRRNRQLPSESGSKRARHAARTSLAHSIPWTLCANTHYPSDPSGAKRPPRSASPTKFGKSQRQPLVKAPSPKVVGPRPSILPHTAGQCNLDATKASSQQIPPTFGALSSATIGSLRCSSQSANLVLFLPLISSSRVES